tara:strand:+ start:200 stop:979 length:780 start_codon:yes stop_codon:yes gene_type:complete
MKKRTTNMNIHHKNMKQVSRDMQAWTESHLNEIGIYDCTYSHCDMYNGTRTPITTSYEWYCIYSEKNLDLLLPQRIEKTGTYWSQENQLYASYENFAADNFYKLDLFNKLDEGYEMFSIGCNRYLTPQEYKQLQYLFKVIAYEAQKIRKKKPHITLELRTCDELKKLHSIETNSFHSAPKKAKFQSLILTPKEQLYIGHLMFNLTHKEIAYKYNCSETAVRKVILNIKRKLGNEYYSNSVMFEMLHQKQVLSHCLPFSS